MRKPLLFAGVALGLAVLCTAQGGNETGPPALGWGPPTQEPPPPPPPPQPATATTLRVAYVPTDRGTTLLRLEVAGPPGAAFLVGAVRPGLARPVVLTGGQLDASGRWSLERELTHAQARALGAAELVLRAR